MTKGKYLKIAGTIILIFVIILLVISLVNLFALTFGATWAVFLFPSVGTLTIGWGIFLSWLAFALYCFLLPAIPIAIIEVGKLVDERDDDSLVVSRSPLIKPSETNLHENDINETLIPTSIDSLRTSDDTETVVEEAPVGELETIKPVEGAETDETITRGKDPNSYEVGNRIRLYCDTEVDGVIISRGVTGTITNAFNAYGGKKYEVKLDGQEDPIMISGKYFE